MNPLNAGKVITYDKEQRAVLCDNVIVDRFRPNFLQAIHTMKKIKKIFPYVLGIFALLKTNLKKIQLINIYHNSMLSGFQK